MGAGLVDRIEAGTARGAAALFAAAVGYAAYGLSITSGLDPQLSFGAAGAGALAYLPCSRLLGARRPARFAVPDFVPCNFDFVEAPEELLLTEQVASPDELLLTDQLHPDELVLTDDDRADAPLDLDDILAELGPDSRVVRLFDRKAMPAPATPGQLQSRIADHLKDGARPLAPATGPAPSDAAQALSAALAELRRSLR
jgi:hypothetical protein